MTTPGALFVDVSERTKLRIMGSDRVRFLNGQITNDLRNASETVAIEACILNTKGKMDAHVFVSSGPDCFFLDTAPELRSVLPARLERYVIADDVQIDDVTDQFSMFHVLSPTVPEFANNRLVSVRRYAQTGWDIWIKPEMCDVVLQQISSTSHLLDRARAEAMRIEQGIPRWSRELTEQIIPVEANLEERAISYDKGCYIGQEVISRMKMSGQTNKRLCGLISLGNTRLEPGMKLASAQGKEIGWITSATRSERLGKEIALGYVKRGYNDLCMQLEAFAPAQRALVEVAALPFA